MIMMTVLDDDDDDDDVDKSAEPQVPTEPKARLLTSKYRKNPAQSQQTSKVLNLNSMMQTPLESDRSEYKLSHACAWAWSGRQLFSHHGR